MKICCLFFLVFSSALFGQRRLNDPSIVHQMERRVFQSWGNFSPYPKYLLGVQTNLSYATVWGMWAPERNRRYKDGPDLRPLGPAGEETARLLVLRQQGKQTLLIEQQVDSLYQNTQNLFLQRSPASLSLDPLWTLYYKGKLEGVRKLKENPVSYLDFGFSSPEAFFRLEESGATRRLKEMHEILIEKYKIATTERMERGERILLCHEILLSYRNYLSQKSRLEEQYENYRNAQERLLTLGKAKNSLMDFLNQVSEVPLLEGKSRFSTVSLID